LEWVSTKRKRLLSAVWALRRRAVGVIGHADRVADYCTGLLLPDERKNVEPMRGQRRRGRRRSISR
jgi:SRSO17 transposase